MIVTFTKSDIGKPITTSDGRVGFVADVRHGTAYVDIDPDVSASIRTRLGWGRLAEEANTYPLEPFMVAHVTDDRVRLRDRP
jgi:hypothetical protein